MLIVLDPPLRTKTFRSRGRTILDSADRQNETTQTVFTNNIDRHGRTGSLLSEGGGAVSLCPTHGLTSTVTSIGAVRTLNAYRQDKPSIQILVPVTQHEPQLTGFQRCQWSF